MKIVHSACMKKNEKKKQGTIVVVQNGIVKTKKRKKRKKAIIWTKWKKMLNSNGLKLVKKNVIEIGVLSI